MKKVFIDGSAGTTGLRIRERLSSRADLELVVLPDEVRKDVSARRDALNSCDVAFLCLPDAAAIEAVSLVESPNTVIIDTSTAHRTSDGWQYGFPELAGRRAAIVKSKRIANPGCHASGFIALVEPLVRAGIVAKDEKLSVFSLTGYSGGGKKMIAEYEPEVQNPPGGAGDLPRPFHLFLGGRQYALGQSHKHLPEMVKVCGLDAAPCFSPIVVPHYSGMEVTVPLFDRDLAAITGNPPSPRLRRTSRGWCALPTILRRRKVVFSRLPDFPGATPSKFLATAMVSASFSSRASTTSARAPRARRFRT